MPKTNSNDVVGGIVILLGIIFLAGRYFSWWVIKQKVLFYQNIFWASFWFSLLLLIASIVLLICFIFKEENNYSYYHQEFFDKTTFGWSALIVFIIFIFSFFMMIHSYQQGFSEEAMKKLAEAQGKIDEFNYIRDVLTGVEIKRLMVGGIDEAMQDICTSNDYNCQQLTQSYQSIKNILEAKERADNIMNLFGFVEKN